MQRIRPKIQKRLSDLQQGFIPGRGTQNAIFCLRVLTERALEINKDIHLCFVDYNKAFDTVDHGIWFEILEKLKLDSKDIRILKQLYWQQTASIKVDENISRFVEISRGVRQGCVLSPDLFNLYSEAVFESISHLPGIKIGGRNINNIRYANDTVLIAESAEKLQALIYAVEDESKKINLTINIKKIVYMIIKKNQIANPGESIKIQNKILNKPKQFKYLGSIQGDNK